MEYENRIVAFIDILGFSEMIRNSEENEDVFITVHKALEEIRNINRNLQSETREKSLGRQEALFSDNIVISYSTNSPEAEFELIYDAMFLQLCLLYEGVLVRGGITTGKLFHNSNMIFGPALVRAYELESKHAIYPRVLVDDNCVNGSGTVFSRDFDGLTFLNFIENFDYCNSLFKKMYNISDFQYYSNIKNIVIDKIKACSNTNIKAKLMWLDNYFNQTFKLNNGTINLLNSRSTFYRAPRL